MTIHGFLYSIPTSSCLSASLFVLAVRLWPLHQISLFLIRLSIHFCIQPFLAFDSVVLSTNLHSLLVDSFSTAFSAGQIPLPYDHSSKLSFGSPENSFLHLRLRHRSHSQHGLLQRLTGRSRLHNTQYNPRHEYHRSSRRHRR